jgi:uncharacterized membrane protein
VPSRSGALLAGLLGVSGTAHFLATDGFARIVPRWLGNADAWVYASGVAELALAGGLLHPRTRRAAAYATAGLFVAVFPANVKMALDAGDASAAYRAVVYARLPLQVPLIGWALWIARRGSD